MKPSLQKPRLSTRWKFILNKNEIHEHIKIMNIDIEHILTHLKRETKYIQLNEGKYTKL